MPYVHTWARGHNQELIIGHVISSLIIIIFIEYVEFTYLPHEKHKNKLNMLEPRIAREWMRLNEAGRWPVWQRLKGDTDEKNSDAMSSLHRFRFVWLKWNCMHEVASGHSASAVCMRATYHERAKCNAPRTAHRDSVSKSNRVAWVHRRVSADARSLQLETIDQNQI